MVFYQVLFFVIQSISVDVRIDTKTVFVFKGEFNNGEPMGIPINIGNFSDGSFVLQEYQVDELKRFSYDGDYLNELSSGGRGPGEFIDIDYIFVNKRDQLLAIDHKQLKLTVIGLKDNEQEDYRIFKSRPRVRSIHQLSNGTYILGYSKYFGSILQADELFYTLSSNYKLSEKGFVHPNDLSNGEIGSLPNSVMRGGKRLTDKSVLTTSDDLVVVPIFYTGEILIMDRLNELYEAPRRLRIANYGTAYEEFPKGKTLTMDVIQNEGVSSSSNSTGTFMFYHYNRSLGLFRLKTGEIVHFAQIKKGDKTVLMIEILDEKARNVITTQELDAIGNLLVKDNLVKGSKYDRIDLVFHHLDNQNRLYISKFGKNSEPELHVIQLDILVN